MARLPFSAYIHSSVILMVWAWPDSVWAAFLVTVNVDTVLRSDAYLTSPARVTLPRGAQIKTGNAQRRGFLWVQTADKQLGWVSLEDVTVTDTSPVEAKRVTPKVLAKITKNKTQPENEKLASDERENNSENETDRPEKGKRDLANIRERNFRLSALLNYNFFSANGIMPGLSQLSNGIGFGGQAVVQLGAGLGLALRIESLSRTANLVGADGVNAQASVSTLPISVGVEWTFVKSSTWSLRFSGLGGIALNTGVALSVPSVNASSNTSGTAWTAQGVLSAARQVGAGFSVSGEVRYRYLNSAVQNVSPSANTEVLTFLNPSYSVNFSGFAFGLGIDLAF